ncbi:MAG: GGDEF domain-containing protein, partial [Casimicrobiaceae bacterium]
MKSIRSNILAFAILATLVPSVGLGLMSFVGYQDVINRNVDYELRALAKDAGAELALWVRERAYDLRTLSTASTLVEGLTGGAPRPGAARIGEAELALYLRSVQKKLDPLLELTLRDTDGRVVASSAQTPSPADLPSTWPATALSTGAVVVPPHWNDALATPTMA